MNVRLMLSVSIFAAFGICAHADLSVDFSKEVGPVRRALHSSGFAPRSVGTTDSSTMLRDLHFDYSRTHDLALVNQGQRVVDAHFIFPLMHLDAKNPSNYYFKATDHLLQLTRNMGYKIFYRLGTSIEHSGPTTHFNSVIPDDFDKMAEVFAGTIRHYNRGWADGFKWDIKYWEIWNEPDGRNNMWCFPNGSKNRSEKERRDLFIKFFVTCCKRIKSEFPEVKVGGPALCYMNESYFKELLKECKKAGVTPDFISWHYYGFAPDQIISGAEKARKLCDSFGFTDCELIINEWHYLGSYGWGGLRNNSPEVLEKVWNGPGSHNGINSSCFTLSTLAQLQFSKYDQAYFYGCSHTGAWGYMDVHRRKYKIWYALALFGSIMKECPTLCASGKQDTISTLAAKSGDGKSGWLLVSDYKGKSNTITLDVKGVSQVTSATLLDHERNNTPVEVKFEGGKLTLEKKLEGSAAFLVKFTLQ